MTPKLLAFTRTLIAVAVAVSGFIIRNATKITTGATAIHAWSLTFSVKLADRTADKQYKQFVNLRSASTALATAAATKRAAWYDACDAADAHADAAGAELTLLRGE